MRAVDPTLILVLALALLVAGTLGGCSSPEVRYDYDPSYSFKQLRTFDWTATPPSPSLTRFDEERLRTALGQELVAKGIARFQSGGEKKSPDCLVRFQFGKKLKIQQETTWWTNKDVSETTEGTLLLDIIDTGTRKVVWRGSIRGEMDPDASPEERTKRARRAASLVLADFPPRSG